MMVEQSPLERAARAMYHSVIRFEQGDDFEWPDVATSQTADEWRDAARAVLMAIREPSNAMLNADSGQDERWDGVFVRNAWRAMIDVALEEK